MRTPLTMDDYLASRWIVEPLRLFDCCLETDAAVAVVITSTERAARPATDAGHDLGRGVGFGPHAVLEPPARPRPERRRPRAAAGSGSRRASGRRDVDVAELYDAFTPLVLIQLEDYGFCGPGEGADAEPRAGTLPVNTHGGHLSEGYVHGLNHWPRRSTSSATSAATARSRMPRSRSRPVSPATSWAARPRSCVKRDS